MCLRFLLLMKYNAGIQPVPPIVPLNRNEQQDAPLDNEFIGDMVSSPDSTVVLKRSGRVIRTLDSGMV